MSGTTVFSYRSISSDSDGMPRSRFSNKSFPYWARNALAVCRGTEEIKRKLNSPW